MIDHINRNPKDNRLCNLQASDALSAAVINRVVVTIAAGKPKYTARAQVGLPSVATNISVVSQITTKRSPSG